MAVKIRLKRFGKRGKCSYRIVVLDEAKKRQGKEIETLGFYDPNFNPAKVSFKNEKVQYWLNKGAQTSETVYQLLKKYGGIFKLPHSKIGRR